MDYSLLSSTLLKKSRCPQCQTIGNDNAGDNLATYADGHSFCYACGYLSFSKQTKANTRQTKQTLDNQVLPMYTVEAVLSKRNISPEVIKQYGVRMEQTEDGQLELAFPLHDINRSEYTKHLRAVDSSTGELTRNFRYPKGSRLKLPVFGWQLVKKQQTLVICEGETDALILASRLVGRTDVCVLGLVGVANSERLAAHLCTNANTRRVVLAFDNDSAGQLAVEKLVAYVDKHEADLKLYTLAIPSQHKDVGDWLTEDLDTDAYQAIVDASPVEVVGLLGAEQIADRLDDYIHKLREQTLVDLQFSPTLSEAIRLLPGKLIGVGGDAGNGKSTFVEHIAMEALQQKYNVLFASQEMSPAEVALKLLRMVRNQPLDNPRFLKTLSPEEILEIKNQLKRIIGALKTTDGFGVLSVEELDKRIHKSVSLGFHPDLVIVDNLFAISKNLEANAIIDLCYKLKALAANHETCVILLSHVRKQMQSSKRVLYRPQLSDLYGSNGLQAAADLVLCVATDKAKKETYVETVKWERLGGLYADVTLKYQDYCFHETDDVGHTDYDGEQEYEEEEVGVY